MARGIDYGMGLSNIDHATGIRYGVINMNALASWAWDEMEGDYGPPTCGKCGNEALRSDEEGVPDLDSEECEDWEFSGCRDYVCLECKRVFDSSESFANEAYGHYHDTEDLKISVDTYNDAMILKSEFFTFARFCSPCVPGAGDLESPDADGAKTYCLDQSWFDKEQPCPYPVYSVETGDLLYTPEAKMATNDKMNYIADFYTVDDAIMALTAARDRIGGDACFNACLVGSQLEDVNIDTMRIVDDGNSRYVEVLISHPALMKQAEEY